MLFLTLLSTVSATCLINAIGWEKCPNDKYWAYPTELFVISRKCSRSSLICELELAPKRNALDETVCTKTYTIQLSDMCESLVLPGKFRNNHIDTKYHLTRLLHAISSTKVSWQTTANQRHNGSDQHNHRLR